MFWKTGRVQILVHNPNKWNCMQEKTNSSLNLETACYIWMQNLLSSSFLYKNIKIKIHRIIILSVIFYGCGTWSVMFGQRLFEKGAEENIWAWERRGEKRVKKAT